MIRVAQLLLLAAAAGLWAASRLPWVSVTSFDGLGPPTTATLSGAEWSTALLPLAVLLLAAALAGLAARGWLLRAVALLVAPACLALGYLGASLIVMPDIGPRGAAVAGVPVAALVASDRHPAGAIATLAAAAAALAAAALMMRAAAREAHPGGRYQAGHRAGVADADGLSDRGLWDALDAGRDPTSDTEGR